MARKIVVNDVPFTYSVGRGAVRFKNEITGVSGYVGFDVLTGHTWHTLEKSMHKGGPDHRITPGQLADYLKRKKLASGTPNALEPERIKRKGSEIGQKIVSRLKKFASELQSGKKISGRVTRLRRQ